jgi:hypothetical protein
MLSTVILKTSSPWMTKATKYFSGGGIGVADAIMHFLGWIL